MDFHPWKTLKKTQILCRKIQENWWKGLERAEAWLFSKNALIFRTHITNIYEKIQQESTKLHTFQIHVIFMDKEQKINK